MNLALIGFMGAFKTQAGRLAAGILNMDFADCDALFEERFGISPAVCIEKFGECEFRLKESELLISLSNLENTLIATGGGAVLSVKAMSYLSARCFIIWLRCDFKTAAQRVGNAQNRPLFKDKAVAAELFEQRIDLYKKYANASVITDDSTPEEVAKEIVRLWNQRFF